MTSVVVIMIFGDFVDGVDSAAASELRRLIRQHLSEEIKRLKMSIDQQIKQSEDEINKKLQAAETHKTSSSPKAATKAKKK